MTAVASAAALAASSVFALAAPAAQAAQASQAAAIVPGVVSNPASYVDPLIGTGSGGDIVGSINEFPGPDVPFGMLQWSPDTNGNESAGGYYYDDTAIKGFSLTHLSGVGCNAMGDVPFLPTTGAVPANPQAATSPFSHDTEQASAGYYAVTLADSGIRAQLTTTLRTGIAKFTYPQGTTANMLVKAGDSLSTDDAATVQVVGNNEIVGSVTTGHICALSNQYTVYFAAVFDHPFTATGTWTGTTVTPGSTQASAPNAGAYVSFDTSANPVVQVKTAISYVSVAGAEANLAAEQPGWDFAGTHAAAVAAWNRELGKIKVGGGTPAELTTFYTALYHAMLDPDVFSDADGQYMGFDGQVHQLPAGHLQYANYSGWDIYRSETSLLALLNPQRASDMAQSLVNDAAQGGWLSKWPEADSNSTAMNGDAADPILANFAAYGGSAFDKTTALAEMIKGATDTTSPPGQFDYVERPDLASYLQDGYVPNTDTTDISPVPNGASETLEYAIDDFAISQFAQSLGQKATAQTYLTRSQNWTNLFNTGSGYIQPRDAQGQFPAGDPVTDGMSTFGQSGFQEGNAAQYTWMVPQDLAGLFTAMGGDKAAVSRLDTFFTQLNAGPNEPYMWAGNEPSLDTPWEYDYAGAPYRTQDVVRQIMTQLYAPTPGGAPGNDDLGAMSAWYVWAALGMYPETPGVPQLVLGSPLFQYASISLPHGKSLTVRAPQASATTPYVHGLTVNGHTWDKTWLPASAIHAGGTLSYTLAATPDTSWGAARQDAPHSYPAGPLHFPAGLVPASITANPPLDTAAGSQASTTLTFQVGAALGAQGQQASQITSLTWNASPPDGITLSPSSGTVTVGSDGTATVSVTAAAAAGLAQGFYEIPVTVSSSPSVPLPALQLDVGVIGTGDTAHTCTALGATNSDQGLQQDEYGGDGVTTPVTVDGMSGRQTVQVVAHDLNMYFIVDPRIAANGTFTATFTVTYYDTGTNTWVLQYDSNNPNAPLDGAYATALVVTNTNTDTWKTATATVTDARFDGRENGSADFRINSGAPVTLHEVQATISGTGVLPMDICS